MKILHTEWSLGWGGQEIRIISEMEAFRERGYEMILAARSQSLILKEAKERGFKTYVVEFGFALNPFVLIRLKQIAREVNADLIHTHSSKDSWIGGIVGYMSGIPVVRSRHTTSDIKPKPSNTFIYQKIPSAIIPSGKHIADYLMANVGCEEKKMFSAPAGADEKRFKPRPESRLELRKELGLPEDTLIVGMVAVLRSWKGHHVLLHAVQKLIAEGVSFHVVIAGDGPQREPLKSLSSELGIENNVTFLGHRANAEQCFQAIDVHVLPSIKNEATSQVTPQAMLCGIPCIVSDAGGLTEVIQDKKNGLVVPADDVTALKDAIGLMIKDAELRTTLAEAGYKDALNRLTFTQQIDTTEDAYQYALKSRG